MKERFLNIVSLFFCCDNSIDSITEEHDSLMIRAKGNELQFPRLNDFQNTIAFINSRDNIHLSFLHNTEILENFSCHDTSVFETFIEKLKKESSGIESFELIITIEKRNKQGKISVYFPDHFVKYINDLQLFDILFVFNELYSNREFVFFEIQDQTNKSELTTASIFFSSQFSSSDSIKEKRILRTRKIKNICHCNILDDYDFIPEDFYPLKLSSEENLNILFKKISIVYSLIYLFDIINIDENEIDFRLNGYKTIFKRLQLQFIAYEAFQVYFKIYDWVYDGGGTIDKIGLARNIISLNINVENLFIDESVFNAIQSGYKIYQKENIKQYIEIRNKISDQLIEIQKNADKIVDDFIADFKKSLFIFVSFFASVLVLKVVSSGNFSGGFSKEVTLLSIGFLLIGFITMIIKKKEIKRQVRRYAMFYENMKERYCDLLDSTDINRILNEDKDFKNNVSYIEARVKEYSSLWAISIAILLIVVLVLHLPNCVLVQNVNCEFLKILLRCFITNILP